MKLIGVTGFARAGKDTVGSILTREQDYVRFAFADPIKKMVADMLEMSLHRLEELKDHQLNHLDGLTPRYLMQTLGTEWGRDMIHKDLWVRLLREKIVLHADLEPSTNIVVTDVRFPEEVAMIRELGGSIWKVVRETEGPVMPHESEAYVDSIEADEDLLNITGDLSMLHTQVIMYHFDTPHIRHLPE
jgi:hypothetical protein